MRNILNLFRKSLSSLPYSELYSDKTFYHKFISDLQRCDRNVLIESPFLTRRRITQLASTMARLNRKGVCITVLTRSPSEYDGYSYIQVVECISYLRLLGVKVKTMDNHYHRKLAILDDHILWEGSLNILSQHTSVEIMRRTKSIEAVHQMKLFLKLHR